jgi:hypothetical protein
MILITAIAWGSPVPDTGQTKCYNDEGDVITCPSPGQRFYGQDGNYSINPMSYTKLDGNGNALPDSATSWIMVKDNVTGLIWEMKTNKDGKTDYSNPHDADNEYTWYDSNPATNGGNAGTLGNGTDTEDFIKALNDAHYGGYNDWRMPTIKELAYIVDHSIPYPGPTINTAYFPNTAASWYWSSTTHAGNTYYAWLMYFSYGSDRSLYKGYGNYARAVRGGQSGSFGNSVIGLFDSLNGEDFPEMASSGNYTDNGDGTVTDVSTGLMWQQDDSSESMNWEEALAYCDGLNLGGYTDWRLPNKKELRSLVDYSRYNPAINSTYFPNTNTASWYWSSTTSASGTSLAWIMDFNGGYDSNDFRDDYSYARAVRGGQYWLLGNLVISPSSRSVPKEAGSTTFGVTNTGTGTMAWTASVVSGGEWLTITSGSSGSNAGTITCGYTANTGTTSRTATIRVTASEASGSPADVTVTQAGAPVQTVLSVTPSSRSVAKETGSTSFSVSNTGTGTMSWTASVTSGGEWLTITSGSSGSNAGTIACGYTANTAATSRTATLRVTATGATNSPTEVTVTQAATPVQTVLSVTPASQTVAKEVGSTSFSVSNTGNGTMAWTASVISGGEWLTITSGNSGSNAGTIACGYSANTGTTSRTATIRVTASGATNSPTDVTVTQAATPVQTVLSVTPTSQSVAKEAGSTNFSVSNTGNGTMSWTASVTSGGEWLTITSGSSGSNAGTIACGYSANTGTTSRSATIRVTATGATGSPTDVTVTQAATPVQTVLSVTPASQVVSKETGIATFTVSNAGNGTMSWTASVISGSEWLMITSGNSGSNAGTITCGYMANTGTTSRTATIRVTASEASGSPTDVTVTQAATPVQPVLSVTPASRVVAKDAASTSLSVSNAGTGTMAWTAAVTSGGGWLRITSGTSGSDSGTITCAFDANTGASSRTAGIRITAPGATGSPVDVSVTQAANTTQCTATIDGNLSMHIPLLSHLIPWWGAPSYTVDLVYAYNPSYPTIIIFKLTQAALAQSGVYLCDPSTLADDFTIHILDALLPDGITRMWLDLTYSQALSTNGVCFYVSNYGVISK